MCVCVCLCPQRTKLNCYGDNHEDLALCELRSEEARGHIGIWGPFAMLNHSCAPNAINYVVGDSMVVRATRCVTHRHTHAHAHAQRERGKGERKREKNA